MNPLISIIVPVYNAEKWLDKCISSIISQTYTNWELILVDDGSTDNSLDICRHFAESETRIKVFTQENAGPSKARNKGIIEAEGNYIMFVDSDDFISEECLENLIKYNGVDLIIGGISHIYKNEEIIRKYYIDKDTTYSGATFISGLVYGEYNVVFLSPCSKLYKSSIIKQNKICFDEGLKYGEDQIFNQVFLDYCKSFTIVKASDYFYTHFNPESLTSHITKPELLFEYTYRMLQIRKNRIALYGSNTAEIKNYQNFVNRNNAYQFWEAVYLTSNLYFTDYKKRKITIYPFLKKFRFKEIYNLKNLPLAYQSIQIANLLLPFWIADKVTTFLIHNRLKRI